MENRVPPTRMDLCTGTENRVPPHGTAQGTAREKHGTAQHRAKAGTRPQATRGYPQGTIATRARVRVGHKKAPP